MKHLRFSTAGQVIDAFPNLRGQIPATNLELEPFAFIDSLLAQGDARQAMAFCAFVLPRRDAVQWLCGALRRQFQQPNGTDANLLGLVEEWLKKPVEAARRAALDAGMNDPNKGACAWAALAAGWSGGNLSPSTEQPVPPPQHLTGQAVNVGLTLLVAGLPLAKQRDKMEEFVGDAVALLRHGAS
ncbi:DUF6931 family protein [Methylovirgula sp. 4M-Z18]|uniref:DUF6931 family protein n=1 Tax=Methylovirgula sp. 4M-Z18 TaxID=2293567 RepID=UPI000E2FA36F|nr:hypothetical protein [Methylovirgula sp. 4M-Z18]RFB76356.1 hypothetical protein DYH55_21260 [Methylovirgula sp. 4M-Z18]